LAGWLFRVTGQAPQQKPKNEANTDPAYSGVPSPLLEAFVRPLESAGFIVKNEIRQQAAGLLLIICGKKPV
ncbi:MAG TPA: hypothetical protein PKD55_22345, partial [Bellilinea sp.]|nr:hypothetical protein [Bellilinea sp.]